MNKANMITAAAALGLLMTLSGCDLRQTAFGTTQISSSSTTTPNSKLTTSQAKTADGSSSSGKRQPAQPSVSTSDPGAVQSSEGRDSTTQKIGTIKSHSVSASSTGLASGSSSPGKKSSSSQSALKDIEADLARHESNFSVPVYNTTHLGALLKKAFLEEPYIHWVVSKYNWSSQGSVMVKYRETKQQTSYVDSSAKRIVNEIVKPGMTGFEKEKVIHDWIVRHVQYDNSLHKYTAYDALTTGSAVCQGYALLTYQMLTDAGIPTKFVSGTAGGESHLWNEVYIDGKWYQLDVTWDDPVGQSPSAVSYGYFNLTNQQLAATHKWNENSVPVANTDFVSELRTLLKSDATHAKQYESILTAIGGNLPTATTPANLSNLLTKAVDARETSYTVRIKASPANTLQFVKEAFKQLRVSVRVSTDYSYDADARKGPAYTDVHFHFKYKS